jgi:stage V sporulation protein D (sporulation-specific penicillin-binding protein)
MAIIFLSVRLFYICVIQHEFYSERAKNVQERSRAIKAKRGLIYDRNGNIIADNKVVYTISVIHNQITDSELVIEKLTEILGMDEATVRKKVEKYSMRELIRSNVSEEKAELVEELELDGVKVDADYKRYYPYGTLASKVIGFTGSDNQGILGLEVFYDDILTGTDGSIDTVTTARGTEIEGLAEVRNEGEPGNNLVTTLDINLQSYVEELAETAREKHSAKRVCIIIMNPQNGEIYAMTDTPEYDLNSPFELVDDTYFNQLLDAKKEEIQNAENSDTVVDKYGISALTASDTDAVTEIDEEALKQDALNQMWRCFPTNDTYEPGSIFKIVTAVSALEDGVVTVNDGFYCPGYRIVADRRIKCHKTTGHGAETFTQGFMNSCNPVFMDVGARVGAESLYIHMKALGLFEKTGIDLPGEANSIFHKQENVGPLELATMSFGQSFQITPLQLIRAVSAVINGGTLVTPHFGLYVTDSNDNITGKLSFEERDGVISIDTSETMKQLLKLVVEEGGGTKAYIEGYETGGKTATSEKLPRGNGKYIASFIGFAPVDDPELITLIMIDEPVGAYYGGTIAAPIAGEMYESILPYFNMETGDKENE